MMRAQGAPRKVYTRNGVTHLCFQGLYFRAPKGSKIDPEREVNGIELMDRAGGKARIAVHQKVQGKTVTETWNEANVPVHPRKQGKKQGRAAASA